MNTFRSALSLAAFLAVLTPAVASSDAWIPPPGDRYSEFRASHLSSGDFFDTLGVRQFYPVRAFVEGREVVWYNEIGWKDHLSLLFALPLRSLTERSDVLRETRTVTGFGDLTLGARYALMTGETALSVQAEWKAPLGYQHTSAPSLGSGQQDLIGRVNFGMGLRRIDGFFELSGGYRYRFEDPADEIEVGADLGFWIRSTVLVGGQYSGFMAIGASDALHDVKAHIAGPRVTLRIDDGLDVFAGSSYLFDGTSVGKFDEYYAGFAFKRTRLNRLQGYLGGKRSP